jgi:hypothetical protein
VKVAASTVWEILQGSGISPAPERASTTWADFLRSEADAPLACDCFETVTLSGARLYVFAAIEHANRRIRILGATAHSTTSWVTQAAKNLVMDLERRVPQVTLFGRGKGDEPPLSAHIPYQRADSHLGQPPW